MRKKVWLKGMAGNVRYGIVSGLAFCYSGLWFCSGLLNWVDCVMVKRKADHIATTAVSTPDGAGCDTSDLIEAR